MQRIKLEVGKLNPGMKLAEPIINPAGITLMPAGIRLTPMFIIRLKKWNIESVHVYVDTPRDNSEFEDGRPEPERPTRAIRRAANAGVISPEQEAFARAVAEEVMHCFVNVKDNPLMMRLRNIAIKKLVAHGRDGMLNILRQKRLAASGGES